MNFPNAANGVKKIFASEVMILFAAIFSLITALMTFTAFVAASNNSVMGGIAAGSGVAIFGFASLILFVAGYITNFIGIKKASADEEDFKKAFYALVIGLVAVIISVLLSENKMLSSACDIINNVAQLFVTVYVIQGIRNIAVKIGDSEVDIATARNAGIDCISVSWGFRSEQTLREAGAAAIAPDVDALLALLE